MNLSLNRRRGFPLMTAAALAASLTPLALASEVGEPPPLLPMPRAASQVWLAADSEADAPPPPAAVPGAPAAAAAPVPPVAPVAPVPPTPPLSRNRVSTAVGGMGGGMGGGGMMGGGMGGATGFSGAVSFSGPGEPPEPPEPPELQMLALNDALTSYQMVGDFYGGRKATPLIVLAGDKPDPAKLTELREDLGVMSRILTKCLQQASGRDGHYQEAMGISVSSAPARSSQSLYLEGFGVLFQLSVGYALIPQETVEAKPEKVEDNTWETAKREFYGQRSATTSPRKGAVPVKYDPERVEALKKTLLGTLKHAVNIRNLGPEDTVVVIVQGPAAGSSKALPEAMEKRYGLSTGTTVGGTSTLSLRAKKRDLDALGEGRLDASELAKRVTLLAF